VFIVETSVVTGSSYCARLLCVPTSVVTCSGSSCCARLLCVPTSVVTCSGSSYCARLLCVPTSVVTCSGSSCCARLLCVPTSVVTCSGSSCCARLLCSYICRYVFCFELLCSFAVFLHLSLRVLVRVAVFVCYVFLHLSLRVLVRVTVLVCCLFVLRVQLRRFHTWIRNFEICELLRSGKVKSCDVATSLFLWTENTRERLRRAPLTRHFSPVIARLSLRLHTHQTSREKLIDFFSNGCLERLVG
jgi:hypothetical protein